MKQRIYIDTSVVGGYFDEEFSETTKDCLKEMKLGYPMIEIRSPKDLIRYED